MFHTLLDSLRADCRCSPESRLLAGTSGLPAKPPPETSARRSGKILRLAWAGGGFSGVGGLTISLPKGGFALARIYRDYRHHKNCQQTNDRGDGEDCEICGLDSLNSGRWCKQVKFSDSGFFLAMTQFRRLPRTRSVRHSEALTTAGSLLTEDRAPLRAMV